MSTLSNYSNFEINKDQKTLITGGERPWVLRNLSATPSKEEISKLMASEQTISISKSRTAQFDEQQELEQEFELMEMDF